MNAHIKVTWSRELFELPLTLCIRMQRENTKARCVVFATSLDNKSERILVAKAIPRGTVVGGKIQAFEPKWARMSREEEAHPPYPKNQNIVNNCRWQNSYNKKILKPPSPALY